MKHPPRDYLNLALACLSESNRLDIAMAMLNALDPKLPLPGCLHEDFYAEERKARAAAARKAHDDEAARAGAVSISKEEETDILQKLAKIAGKKGGLP